MTALECPHCHSLVVFPANMAGKAGSCPNCAREIQVPSQSLTEEELHKYLRRMTRSGPSETPPRDDDTIELPPKSSRSDTDV